MYKEFEWRLKGIQTDLEWANERKQNGMGCFVKIDGK